MCELNTEWIVLGSSPGAAKWEELRKQLPDANVITANRGIKLCETPDVYFLGGEVPVEPGMDEITDWCIQAGKDAQANGVRVISLTRTPDDLKRFGLDWLSEFVPTAEVGSWRPWRFICGKYTACDLSGLFCLQYAANRPVTAIHLIGMEGYGDSGHYFDNSSDSQAAIDDDTTVETIGPFTQAVVDACPEIQFTFYGTLQYQVTGDNVTIQKDIPLCNSNSNSDGDGSAPTT